MQVLAYATSLNSWTISMDKILVRVHKRQRNTLFRASAPKADGRTIGPPAGNSHHL